MKLLCADSLSEKIRLITNGDLIIVNADPNKDEETIEKRKCFKLEDLVFPVIFND